MRKNKIYKLGLIIFIGIIIIEGIIISGSLKVIKEEELRFKNYLMNIDNEELDLHYHLIEINRALDNTTISSRKKTLYLTAKHVILYELRDYDKFIEELDATEKYFSEEGKYNELAYIYALANNIYIDSGYCEEGYYIATKYEYILNKLHEANKADKNIIKELIYAKYLKSLQSNRIGFGSGAEIEYMEAEKLEEDNKDINIDNTTAYIKAIYNYNIGDYEATIRFSEEYLSNYKENDYKYGYTKMILAQSLLKTNRAEEAIELTKDIIEFNIEDIPEPFGAELFILEAKLLALKSDIELYYGNTDIAIDYLEKARLIIHEKDCIEYEKKLVIKLIDIYSELEDSDNLINTYKDFSELIQKQYSNGKIKNISKRLTELEIMISNNIDQIVENKVSGARKIIRLLLLIIMIIYFITIRILKKSRIDSLTQLYNRGYFNKIYSRYIFLNKEFYILIFDIDNFKLVNDTYSHIFGDEVLITIAKRIKNIIDKKSKLFRFGGEEFIILTEDKTKDEIIEFSESILQEVNSIEWSEDIKITISMGVAKGNKDIKYPLKIADKNLYHSKKTGKNKITY